MLVSTKSPDLMVTARRGTTFVRWPFWRSARCAPNNWEKFGKECPCQETPKTTPAGETNSFTTLPSEAVIWCRLKPTLATMLCWPPRACTSELTDDTSPPSAAHAGTLPITSMSRTIKILFIECGPAFPIVILISLSLDDFSPVKGTRADVKNCKEIRKREPQNGHFDKKMALGTTEVI